MAKLLMSLPVEALKKIPTYDTTEHEKALNAYNKILNCLKTYKELQQRSLSVNEATPQPCANINPLSLSPNDKHYRLLHQRQREKNFVEDLSLRPDSQKKEEAGTKVAPVLHTSVLESLKNSTCKKLFQSPSVPNKTEVIAQAQQPSTENIPSSSRFIPNVTKPSEVSSSSAKCTSTESPRTSSNMAFKAPQAPSHRKFSFGRHRDLEANAGTPSSAGNEITSGLTPTIANPIIRPSNTIGAGNSSALVHASSSSFGSSAVKPLPNNSGQVGVTRPIGKASGFLVNPQPKTNTIGKYL